MMTDVDTLKELVRDGMRLAQENTKGISELKESFAKMSVEHNHLGKRVDMCEKLAANHEQRFQQMDGSKQTKSGLFGFLTGNWMNLFVAGYIFFNAAQFLKGHI